MTDTPPQPGPDHDAALAALDRAGARRVAANRDAWDALHRAIDAGVRPGDLIRAARRSREYIRRVTRARYPTAHPTPNDRSAAAADDDGRLQLIAAVRHFLDTGARRDLDDVLRGSGIDPDTLHRSPDRGHDDDAHDDRT